MKITLKELKELGACTDIYDTFKDAHPSGEATLLQTLDSNGLDDLLWYLDNTKQLSESQHADVDAWTRHQALKVAHLFESDKKDLIINFLKTGENREGTEGFGLLPEGHILAARYCGALTILEKQRLVFENCLRVKLRES